MPRPGPRRKAVATRLTAEDIAQVDAYAEAEGVNQSEMLRRLIGEALTARATPPRNERAP